MADPDFISDEEIWALRYKLRRELIEFARRRLLIQRQRLAHGDFIAFDHLLNPDALTIGFARRFATYKRAPLIFQQLDNIVRLTRDTDRPIQFVFAGKAHPRDDDGKRYIQHIIHLSKYSDLQGHLVFIENYDVHVARQMVSGCDVWLNTPRRPLEASGHQRHEGRLPRLPEPEHPRWLVARGLRRHQRLCHRRRCPCRFRRGAGPGRTAPTSTRC